MFECKLCSKKFEKYTSLSSHMVRTHKLDSVQFYVDYNLNGVWPLCKCGCSEKVKWSAILKKFCSYKQGHQSRVHNNWGNNPDVLKKSLETRRIRFASNEITTWNSGLTVDTDERVKRNGELVSENFTQDRKDRYSDIMRKNRLNGVVPTLHGKDHSQWKGGVSEINVLARARVKLYKEWKYPILIRDGFKCVECGGNDKLHVHHNKEQMCEIVAKHLVDDIKPKTFEEKEFIADAVVDYHITNKVSGITLCGKCHNNLHPSLNFK